MTAHRFRPRLSAVISALKPRDEEILALAEREADPGVAARFEPICHGPWFAVVALAFIGLAAVPGIMRRVIEFVVRPYDRRA